MAAVAALVAAAGLAGCGRKAGLDPPPAAAIGDSGPVQSAPPPGVAAQGRAVVPDQGPQRRTPLDWLID
jgi:predicted small lipoprotein YifL